MTATIERPYPYTCSRLPLLDASSIMISTDPIKPLPRTSPHALINHLTEIQHQRSNRVACDPSPTSQQLSSQAITHTSMAHLSNIDPIKPAPSNGSPGKAQPGETRSP